MPKKKIERTHYTEQEVYRKIWDEFPKISAVSIMAVEWGEKIKWSHAGCDRLMAVAEFERFIQGIRSAKLIERNGFLVPEDGCGWK